MSKLFAIFLITFLFHMILTGIFLGITSSNGLFNGIVDVFEPYMFIITVIGFLIIFLVIIIIKLLIYKLKGRDSFTFSFIIPILTYVLFRFCGPLKVFDLDFYKIFFNNFKHGYENVIFLILIVGALNLLYYLFDVNNERSLRNKQF